MTQNDKEYSIAYIKYYLFQDPFYYYCDQNSDKIENDPNNLFIEYLTKSSKMLLKSTKEYFKKNLNLIDFEERRMSLKSILNNHSFDIIWNPPFTFLGFSNSTFFLMKNKDGIYEICIPTINKNPNLNYYNILGQFYFYYLTKELNCRCISDNIYILPLQSNYLNKENFIQITTTSNFNKRNNGISNYEFFKENLLKIKTFIDDAKNLVPGVNVFPNMKNIYDYPYSNAKKKYSQTIDEITQYYYCGTKQRDYYISKNFGKQYNTKNFGNTNNFSKNEKINKILQNRNFNFKNEKMNFYEKIIIREKSIKSVKNLTSKFRYLCFFDFEVVNNIINCNISNFPEIDTIDSIFNIGVLIWDTKDNTKTFRSYFLNDIHSNDLELKLLTNFFEELDEIKDDALLIHWSSAEIGFLTKFINKCNKLLNVNVDFIYSFNYFDIYKFFVDNEIIVKGMKSFKLKEIYNCLYYSSNDNEVINEFNNDNIESSLSFYSTSSNNNLHIKNECINYLKDDSKKIGDGLQTIGYILMNKENITRTKVNCIINYNALDCYFIYKILKGIIFDTKT